MKPRIQFWIFVLTSLVAYGGMVALDWRTGELGEESTPHYIGWYLLAFFSYVGLILWAERGHPIPWRWVWVGAVLARLLLLLTEPTLSTDVYRYIWDGHVAANGVSPYAYPIESSELDYLAVPVRDLANHTWMASPYMPAAQWVFASLASVFPLQPLYYQMVMIVFDLAAAALMWQLLQMAVLPTRRLLIYLWNPLVIVEIAHGAHIDAWMILLTMLTLWLFLRPNRSLRAAEPMANSLSHFSEPINGQTALDRSTSQKGTQLVQQGVSAVLLALATLTKLVPVLLLPIFFWRWRWWTLVLYGVLVVGLLIPAGLNAGWGLTGELDGHGLFGALRIYGDQWNYNSGLFHWIELGLKNQGIVEFNEWAKRIVAALLIGTLLLVWLAARRATEPRQILRLCSIPMMAYALLSATVHPWYILIVLAFLPFLTPGKGDSPRYWLFVLPWIYLSGAIVFSYLTYVNPQDLREYEWIRLTEWVPTIGLLVVYAILLVVETDQRPIREKVGSGAKP
ncbi:hypothetical protein KFU94_47865 [Chloroflexi bacterium TSY]|nr:hypothetical protein [Chloroflexi bacterium TSY]